MTINPLGLVAPVITREEVPAEVRFPSRPRCCDFCERRGYGEYGLVPHFAKPLSDAIKTRFDFLPRVFWLHGECAEDLAIVRKDQITLHPVKC